ncbi:permease prefix domain 1-containing protein [Nocardioides sp. cx-173]|uniref:permease prefix domain 1-containing protein n=1 Tax=Nocardioides sp. cx-173 TaxID=2898796 RepID=UPI001E388713|nr:permease prefix domain 1-containing protein [Nocardioides sp. cx-173]MCD4525978.1 permease prefix domain 1-containing protein [Nocardioides sp. cx-173]UGB43675.1 permease prefix domain 1-containing protein [Nocardioides sp. cx-173]
MATHQTTTTGRSAASLTDRYVHAATRGLPDSQRDDVADELRASIGDRAEALQHAEGLDAERAEYVALEELGDPARLAAGYSGRALQLIGPELYPAYVRVLRSVLLAAVPTVAVVIAIIAALDGGSAGSILGETLWIAATVALHVCFWITLAFALTERGVAAGDVRGSLGVQWAPDQLPDLPRERSGSLLEMVSTLVWLGLLAGAVVWQQFRSPLGDHEPVLDPDLWSFWLPLILALILVEAAFEVVKYRAAGWSPTLATVNVGLGALFAAPLVYLAAEDRLLNPAAVAEVQAEWSGFDPETLNAAIIVVTLAIWVWDGVDGWLKTRAASAAA